MKKWAVGLGALGVVAVALWLVVPGWLRGLPAAHSSADAAYWVERLKDPSENTQEEAKNELAKIGKPAVPLLIESLKQRDCPRYEVYDALARMPREADAAAQVGEVMRRDESFRPFGQMALGHIGVNAVPTLIELLKPTEDDSTRMFAAMALSEIGPDAKDAVGPLTEALADPRDKLATGTGATEADLAENMSGMATKAMSARSTFAMALGKIGPASRPATPVLIKAAKDKHSTVRVQAVGALGLIGPEIAKEAVPVLREALKDENGNVRVAAASALGLMRGGAKDAVPDLVRALDEPGEVRLRAVYALGLLGPAARSPGVVDKLLKLLDDPLNIRLKDPIIKALAKIDPKALDKARGTP